MNLRTAAILSTGVLWVFWLIPLQGKKFAPELLGTSSVQWSSAVIVAICIPFLVLMALKLLSDPAHKKTGCNIMILATLPLLHNLVMHGIGGTMMARTNLIIQRGHERDIEIISTLTDRALHNDNADSRAKSAGLLYGMFGVQAVWKNSEGQLERFNPTSEEQEMWERTMETLRLEAQTAGIIDSQLKQTPWMLALNIGAFVLVTLGGMACYVYKPNSECSDKTLNTNSK